MNVLSIQSGVVYGHVGNSAAQFCLQRLGHEVWPVFTVHFSNPAPFIPGVELVAGEATTPETVAAVKELLEKSGKVLEVGLGNVDLAALGSARWAGKPWQDTVTVESRDKLAALLKTRPGKATTLSPVRTVSRAAYGSYGGRSRPVRCPKTLRSRKKMNTASARKMMV